MDRLDELRAALRRDPRAVADAASGIAAEARTRGDQALLSRALALLGRARRSLGAVELAEADLLAAIDAARAAGDGDLAADAHLGLAGAYALAGRSADAEAHLDEVQRLGSPRTRAYGSLQRAALDQSLGRLHEALAAYARALPELEARADIALVLMNRGVIRTQLADCTAAIADLTEARGLFAAEDNAYAMAQAEHGLGWAHARRGDLATALRYLDGATDRFRELGHPAPEVDVDRVEVLIEAGLFVAALDAALEVARRSSAAGGHRYAAEAWLLGANAALLGGDAAAAARHAERARVLFAEHGAAAWERAARLALLRARQAGGHPVDPAELRALAGELDRTGNARTAAIALALACVAAAEAGRPDLATPLSVECGRRAARLGLFEVRMQARYAQATCAAAGGDGALARRQVRAGLAELRRYRATLAASDARAAVAVHGAQLAALGLRLAVATGSAAVVLDWMERVRAGGPDGPDPHPPADETLAAELSELRSAVRLARAAEAEGRDTVDLLRRQRDLERRVHRRQLRSAAWGRQTGAGPAAPTPGALRAALHGGRLVELAEVDGRLIGVSVGGAGRRAAGHLDDLGPWGATLDAAAAATATLRGLVAGEAVRAVRANRLELLRRALGVLDRTLAPLLTGTGPVVLVVPTALHAVPWQLVPALGGRPVAVAPSATWWHAQVTGAVLPAPPRAALVVAGPRLSMADSEAAAVARCYPRATVLTGSAATAGAVLGALAGTAVAHVACHGRIRDDNALWSALELFDGPLYLYDLERVPRTPPLVVLSGCETGVGVRVGDQLIGLSSVLLRRGTRSLLASVCAVPDSAATRDTMRALHERVARGEPAAAALAGLSAGWAGDDAGALVAAALCCFGTH